MKRPILVVHKESEENYLKPSNLFYRSGHFSLMCACFVVIISFLFFFFFFFECCLLYFLSPYSVVLSFFLRVYLSCVRVFFLTSNVLFFGLLNMRCLNILYKRYEVFFLSRNNRTQEIQEKKRERERQRKKKRKRCWVNNDNIYNRTGRGLSKQIIGRRPVRKGENKQASARKNAGRKRRERETEREKMYIDSQKSIRIIYREE